MKNLITKLLVLTLVMFSVTSCALLHETSRNNKSKSSNSKEVKSNKQQSSNRR